jgi:hypothetical protein
METNRKSPRSARAIFGRLERRNISRIIYRRPGSGNNYRFDPTPRRRPKLTASRRTFVGNISGEALSIYAEKGGDMTAKKMNCGCECVPPGKTAKRKVKTESAKATKKRK